MLGQLNFQGKTKLEVTLERIKAFEPPEGYYVAFSGGARIANVYMSFARWQESNLTRIIG